MLKGLGFIGNELVRHLKSLGEVAVLDDGHRSAPHIHDLADILVLDVGLTDRVATQRALLEASPEIVFHLAAIHFIPECNSAPDRTLRVNVEGTLNLLDACARAKVKRLLLASSGAVYADSPHPLRESSRIAPVDIYDWTKCFAEELFRNYSTGVDMPVTIARLFNTYGPRETNAHVIPEILQQLRSSDTIHLGNTTARRDYIYVTDCVSALVRLSQAPASRSCTVNVASGNGISVADIVQLLGKALNRDLTIIVDPNRLRRADKQIQLADISLLGELVNWTPETTLCRGLTQLLQFDGLIDAERAIGGSVRTEETLLVC